MGRSTCRHTSKCIEGGAACHEGAWRVRGGRRACMGCGWGWSRWNRVGACRQGRGTSGGAGIRRGTCGARRQRVEKGWDVRWGRGARTGVVAARREGMVRARGAGGTWLRIGQAGGVCDAWNGADRVRGGRCASLGGRARGWGSSCVKAQGGRRWDVWAVLGHVQRGRSGVGPSGVMAACRRGLGCVWEGRGGLVPDVERRGALSWGPGGMAGKGAVSGEGGGPSRMRGARPQGAGVCRMGAGCVSGHWWARCAAAGSG